MKRSEVNKTIDYVIERCEYFKIPLPSFAFYSVDDWKNVDDSEEELVDNMLGWDITDFGKGDFLKAGLVSFVFRNGNINMKDKYPKTYCEKLLYVMDGQILPFHYHWKKTEDIINRGGGNLEITLWQGDDGGNFLKKDLVIVKDGKKTKIHGGDKVLLKPGESITLMPYQFHQWQGVPGTGDIALFEVSSTNDDRVDNNFYESQERLTGIENDEKIKHALFTDYVDLINF